MSRAVGLVGRLAWCALSLLLAVPAGALTLLAATVLDPVASALLADVLRAGLQALPEALEAGTDPAGPAAALGSAAMALLVAPPVLTALVAEVAGFRSLLWHAVGTGALTAAVPWLARGQGGLAAPGEAHLTAILFLSGAAAGLIHWLVAGRDAGGRPEVFVPGARPRG